MAKINSRSKGCRGERDFCKVLKEWTKKPFARTPSSGGLSWKTTNAKGDVTCTKDGHYFPFCVEIKNYKELNFQHLIYLDKAEILKFWEQCKRDALIAKKIPLLAMRYNGLPKGFYFLIMQMDDVTKLKLAVKLSDKANLLYNPKHDILIMHSDILFKTPYKEIKSTLKALKKNK